MPSPQALVAFSLSLFLLLVILRAQVGLGPNAAVAISLIGALGIALVVERLIPPEIDDDEVSSESDGDPNALGPGRESDTSEAS
jgi:hypothetical protein